TDLDKHRNRTCRPEYDSFPSQFQDLYQRPTYKRQYTVTHVNDHRNFTPCFGSPDNKKEYANAWPCRYTFQT
ncbi:MAG: hypothetical protein KKD33_01100, partial [Verrucomicrobia bacterium]|nr:hypothetical protein [Verrucomicrobiota bacterium]